MKETHHQGARGNRQRLAMLRSRGDGCPACSRPSAVPELKTQATPAGTAARLARCHWSSLSEAVACGIRWAGTGPDEPREARDSLRGRGASSKGAAGAVLMLLMAMGCLKLGCQTVPEDDRRSAQRIIIAREAYYWTALHDAMVHNDVPRVKQLLARGADPDATDSHGLTPWALPLSRRAVRDTNRAGAEAHALVVEASKAPAQDILAAQGLGGAGLLHLAAFHGKTRLARKMLALGDRVDRTDSDGATPLRYAADAEERAMVQFLAAKGADLDRGDIRGMTPLLAAAGRGRRNMAELLLKLGAKLDVFSACCLGRDEIVRRLVERRPVLVNTPGPNRTTPLHWASSCGQASTVKLLLQKGANPNPASGSGRTALHYAAEAGCLEAVKALIASGADRDALIAGNEATALHEAALHGAEEVVRFLLKAGVPVDKRDYFGKTPLHWAAQSGQLATARILVAHGAELSVKDGNGWTPEEAAVAFQHAPVARYLREAAKTEKP